MADSPRRTVAKGDLGPSMALEVEGRAFKSEFLRSAKRVNTLIDQLNGFSGEVSRVAREVGTEGKLGGQAVVKGVGGTWRDLIENVNSIATNLTGKLRNIADVISVVAHGDSSRKITIEVRGEILELNNTLDTIVHRVGGEAGAGALHRFTNISAN